MTLFDTPTVYDTVRQRAAMCPFDPASGGGGHEGTADPTAVG